MQYSQAPVSVIESDPPRVLRLDELKQRSERAAVDLMSSGLGPSDPEDRLARKSMLGHETLVELDAIVGTHR